MHSLIFLGSVLLTACKSPFAFAAPANEDTIATTNDSPTSSSTSYIPQKSPIFPAIAAPTDVVTTYNDGPYNLSDSLPTYKLTTGYPELWKIPDPSHPEVLAVIAQIDWSLVPNAPISNKKRRRRRKRSGSHGDQYCYWTDTECVTPKINIPEDLYLCPNKGDWGLTYDDGPFNLYTGKNAALENPYAEPALYNFLANTNNQKATLFYIGTNIATYPAAAKRAFNDGHQICVHTWSHPPMTSVTNQQAVAELYWTIKIIKQLTGVTTKCWRPPQGDVDDRIRSIAWQMGLHTVLWDRDTQDWQLSAPGGGNMSPDKVNGFFEKWIAEEKSGNQTHGHIVLEHELNSMTVGMTEKWLPVIQKDFNVIPALSCNNVQQPYWESNMVYPLSIQPAAGGDGSSEVSGNDSSNNDGHAPSSESAAINKLGDSDVIFNDESSSSKGNTSYKSGSSSNDNTSSDGAYSSKSSGENGSSSNDGSSSNNDADDSSSNGDNNSSPDDNGSSSNDDGSSSNDNDSSTSNDDNDDSSRNDHSSSSSSSNDKDSPENNDDGSSSKGDDDNSSSNDDSDSSNKGDHGSTDNHDDSSSDQRDGSSFDQSDGSSLKNDDGLSRNYDGSSSSDDNPPTSDNGSSSSSSDEDSSAEHIHLSSSDNVGT